MARLRARTYAYLIGIGTPILLAGVLWWFRRQGGPAAPSDQLFALVVGAAMLGTAGILLKRSLPTLGASLALLVLGFPQEILGMVILPSGGLYLIAAFIVGLTDVGEMVGEGIEAGKEGMEESGMNAPEMPSAFQDATDGGETESADDAEQTVPDAEAPDTPEQPVPDAEAPEGPAQPVDAEDVEPITAETDAGAEADADADTRADADGDADAETDEDVPDPEEVVEEHGPHHAPEAQVDQSRVHADDPSVGRIGGADADDSTGNEQAEASADDADASDTATESREPTGDRGTRGDRPSPDEARNWGGRGESSDTEGYSADGTTPETTGRAESAGADESGPDTTERVDRPAPPAASETVPSDEPGTEDADPVDPETAAGDDAEDPEPAPSVEPAGEARSADEGADADDSTDDERSS
jgi:hypothetical protein